MCYRDCPVYNNHFFLRGQVYELIACVRRANENARNLISVVQLLIENVRAVLMSASHCDAEWIVCLNVWLINWWRINRATSRTYWHSKCLKIHPLNNLAEKFAGLRSFLCNSVEFHSKGTAETLQNWIACLFLRACESNISGVSLRPSFDVSHSYVIENMLHYACSEPRALSRLSVREN